MELRLQIQWFDCFEGARLRLEVLARVVVRVTDDPASNDALPLENVVVVHLSVTSVLILLLQISFPQNILNKPYGSSPSDALYYHQQGLKVDLIPAVNKLIIKMSNLRNKPEFAHRNEPSVRPLKSPSPDFSSANAISPTHSPSRGEIKRKEKPNMPILDMDISWQPQYKMQTPSTLISNKEHTVFSKSRDKIEVPAFKYHSHRHEASSSYDLDREELILELKKILVMISDSEFVSEFSAD